MIDKRTRIRREAKYVIADMVERTLDTGVDLEFEAMLAGTTEAALVSELRRQIEILYGQWSR